jgi:outer membrane autotransporter protein
MLLGGTAAIALAVGAPAHAVVLNDNVTPTVAAAANYFDSTNQFPNVVSLTTGGDSFCTGTLVNSRTILTAAHCFFSNNVFTGNSNVKLSFRPDSSSDPTAITATSIKINPGYVSGSTTKANDIALISLATPVTNISPVTLLTANPGSTGFPATGSAITMVGYGGYGTGTNPPDGGGDPSNNRRRVGMSTLAGYFQERQVTDSGLQPTTPNACTDNPANCVIGNGTQPFFFAQFRDPADPNNPNYFNLQTGTQPLEAGVAPGDSGGPLFAMINGQLVQIGEEQGGSNPSGGSANGYGEVNGWTPTNIFIEWLMQNYPLRLVSNAPGDFNWSNAAAWVDGVPGVTSATPNNTVGNVANYATDVARYYRVTLNSPGTVTLDMNPTIDALSIAGAQSQLVIGAPFTLTTLLSTTLSAGALTLTGGTLVSPELLVSGGLLAGNGTIIAGGGSTGLCNSGVCVSGGVVAPVGTLTIQQGNYTQTGGLLQFQLAPTGANGQLVVANGTATLGGTLGATVTPGLYGGSTVYSLITANAINSQFAQFAPSPGSAFLTLSAPSYTANSVNVTLVRTPFGAVTGLSANERAVGNALETGYSTTLTGAAAALYSNLLASPTAAPLNLLSGEGISAAQSAMFASGMAFGSMLFDQAAFWRSGETIDPNGVSFAETPLGYAAEKRTPAAFMALKAPAAAPPRGWRAWVGGFAGSQLLRGTPVTGSADASTSVGGGAMGFDYQLDGTRLVGFAVGGSESQISVPDRATSGQIFGGHVGAYGVADWGAIYASGMVSYGRYDNRTTRTIAGVGPSETATGRFATDQIGARLELGRRYRVQEINVTPFAALQVAELWQHGFTETSATTTGQTGILGLTYQPRTATSLPTFLGAQFDTRFMLANGTVWSPLVRVAWVHEFMPDRSIAAALVSVPGASFAVDGARAARDAVNINVGSRLSLNRYASLFANFDGEFSGRSQSYAGRGGIKVSW